MAYDPLIAILYLIVGVMLGKAWEKSRWIEKFIDTPIKRYSSGMRVRLAFAVAAHLEPEVLLIDEVLAVGDAAFQKKSLGKMGDITTGGRTILFVSHKMASIRKLCKTVYWLDAGRIKKWGPSDEVVNSYEREMLYADSDNSQQQSIVVNEAHGIEVSGVYVSVDSENKVPTLRVQVKGRTIRPIRRLGIGIMLSTLDGIVVTKMGPHMANSMLNNVNGPWEGIFEVKNITRYLAGGEYLVQIRIIRPKIGTILNLEYAAIVRVPLTDVYGTGKYVSSQRHGLVPLPIEFFSRKP